MSVAAALTAAPIAYAQDAEVSKDDVVVARETFRAGEAAFQRGDYETAANSFEVSNRLAPHPFTMFNAGLAWQEAGQPLRAADAFASALAKGGLGDAQAEDASKRLAELRAGIGWVVVEAPSGALIFMNDAEQVRPPATLHAEPGSHEVRVRFPSGDDEAKPVTIVAGQEATLAFQAPEVEQPPPPPPSPPPPPPEAGGPSGAFIAGWVFVGVGAAAAGTAVGLGVAALSARDDYEASNNRDADARDSAATLRTLTNVMWGVAGTTAIAGTILIIAGWDNDDDAANAGGFSGEKSAAAASPSVSVQVGPSYVGLSGTF